MVNNKNTEYIFKYAIKFNLQQNRRLRQIERRAENKQNRIGWRWRRRGSCAIFHLLAVTNNFWLSNSKAQSFSGAESIWQLNNPFGPNFHTHTQLLRDHLVNFPFSKIIVVALLLRIFVILQSFLSIVEIVIIGISCVISYYFISYFCDNYWYMMHQLWQTNVLFLFVYVETNVWWSIKSKGVSL